MLDRPRYLIPHLVFTGVRVSHTLNFVFVMRLDTVYYLYFKKTKVSVTYLLKQNEIYIHSLQILDMFHHHSLKDRISIDIQSCQDDTCFDFVHRNQYQRRFFATISPGNCFGVLSCFQFGTPLKQRDHNNINTSAHLCITVKWDFLHLKRIQNSEYSKHEPLDIPNVGSGS